MNLEEILNHLSDEQKEELKRTYNKRDNNIYEEGNQI